jgi:hypothetical protein
MPLAVKPDRVLASGILIMRIWSAASGGYTPMGPFREERPDPYARAAGLPENAQEVGLFDGALMRRERRVEEKVASLIEDMLAAIV